IEEFGNTETQIDILKQVIADVDKKEEIGRANPVDLMQQKETFSKLERLLRLQDSIWSQRAWVVWLKNGEENT
ncbi:hypothetical protein Ancab_001782, partial [Ancistrocladus abbreviatus]